MTWRNVEPDATVDNITWRMRIECWITKVADTRMCSACCFSTSKIVARTRPSVTFYVHCLYCLWLKFNSKHLFDENSAEPACLVNAGFPPVSERFIKHSCRDALAENALEDVLGRFAFSHISRFTFSDSGISEVIDRSEHENVTYLFSWWGDRSRSSFEHTSEFQ